MDDLDSQIWGYWDAVHYKTEVGDLILDKIFNYHEVDRDSLENFGVLLTSTNIEQHLANIRARQSDYQRNAQAICQSQ